VHPDAITDNCISRCSARCPQRIRAGACTVSAGTADSTMVAVSKCALGKPRRIVPPVVKVKLKMVSQNPANTPKPSPTEPSVALAERDALMSYSRQTRPCRAQVPNAPGVCGRRNRRNREKNAAKRTQFWQTKPSDKKSHCHSQPPVNQPHQHAQASQKIGFVSQKQGGWRVAPCSHRACPPQACLRRRVLVHGRDALPRVHSRLATSMICPIFDPPILRPMSKNNQPSRPYHECQTESSRIIAYRFLIYPTTYAPPRRLRIAGSLAAAE
jgi:hypothetical protein